MSNLAYTSSGTDSASSSSSSSCFNDDASVYIIAVMLAAEQQEQEVMSTQATTTEYMSEAATDCSEAWTDQLDADNLALSTDSDNMELQQQFQTDLTKSNNANQKFTTETEALSASESQMNDAYQSTTKYIQDVLGWWDNIIGIVASRH